MIQIAPILNLNELISGFKSNSHELKHANIWKKNKYDSHFLFSKSAIALKTVLENVYRERKRNINVFIPSYFCQETIIAITNDNYNIIFYDITDSLYPNWESLYERAQLTKPDVFILTHFFGNISSIDNAASFSRKHDAIFIEDCAHIAFPIDNIGKYSDIQFYSLYKHYPVPNGSILIISEKYFKDFSLLEKEESQVSTKIPFFWISKRIIQSLFRFQAKPSLKSFNNLKEKKIEYDSRISFLAIGILNGFTKDKIKSIYQCRIESQLNWKRIISSYIEPSRINDLSSKLSPYLAVFRARDLKEEELLLLSSRNIPFSNWPNLPTEIYQNDQFKMTNDLKRENLCLPLCTEAKFKDFKIFYKEINSDVSVTFQKKINSNHLNAQYNMLQSHDYITAKERTQGYKAAAFDILIDGKVKGYFYVLSKKVGPFNLVRINRGPVLSKNISFCVKKKVFEAIIKHLKLKFFGILFLKTNEDVNITAMLLCKTLIKFRWGDAYSSGIIDLKRPEDILRAQLLSVWRNQLKKAERETFLFKIETDLASFKLLKDKYVEEMKNKSFSGISPDLLESLFMNSKDNFIICSLYLENIPIAKNVIYINNNCATYLIGWNSTKGRALNANNFLLWKIMLTLKSRGVEFFDLGGIDSEKTPGVAKFKLGTNPELYEISNDWIIPLF